MKKYRVRMRTVGLLVSRFILQKCFIPGQFSTIILIAIVRIIKKVLSCDEYKYSIIVTIYFTHQRCNKYFHFFLIKYKYKQTKCFVFLKLAFCKNLVKCRIHHSHDVVFLTFCYGPVVCIRFCWMLFKIWYKYISESEVITLFYLIIYFYLILWLTMGMFYHQD